MLTVVGRRHEAEDVERLSADTFTARGAASICFVTVPAARCAARAGHIRRTNFATCGKPISVGGAVRSGVRRVAHRKAAAMSCSSVRWQARWRPAIWARIPRASFRLAALAQQLRFETEQRGLHTLLVCPGPIARDDEQWLGARYTEQSPEVPAAAHQPGGGAKVRQIDPHWLAGKILVACEKRGRNSSCRCDAAAVVCRVADLAALRRLAVAANDVGVRLRMSSRRHAEHAHCQQKGPGWPCEGCQPGPRFKEDGRGSMHGIIRLQRRMAGIAMHQRLLWSGEPSRTNVSPKVAPVPLGSAAPTLPGYVKRAVSRDGRGRHTAATVCLDSQADKLCDVATCRRLSSRGR